MSDFEVHFNRSESHFLPAKKLKKDDWFDTSYSRSEKAVGGLRFPGVSNGRYKRKHPILTTSGEIIGYLADARWQIGYTWRCVYAGYSFWLTNQTFGATTGGGGTNISVVAEEGNFLFSSKRKFKLVESFSFKESSWKSPDAFKLLDDGRELFVITDFGYCLFNTYERTIKSRANFTANRHSYDSLHKYDFSISPKVKILAVVGSFDGKKDPIDGEYRYKNAIFLFNMDTGNLVGEQYLEIDKSIDWTIDFSEDGRKIRVASDELTSQFELTSS